MPLLAIAHLAVIAGMVLQPPAAAARRAAPAMIVSAIPAPAERLDTAPVPGISDVVAQVDPPEFEVAGADIAMAMVPCALASNVETALRGDTSVTLAVAHIPAKARSVSNSLLVWDGAWASASSIGGKVALDPIRARVEAQVRAAPAHCRDEPVIGPQLVVVPDGDRQIVLAFGSGHWNWNKIL